MRTTAIYNVVERFVSINGEGNKSGILAVFIRFKGCNLNCSYCDTKWANLDRVESERLTAEEIYHYIKSTGIKNVTLTGGEPLIQNRINDLLEILCEDENLEVEVETNGSKSIASFIHYKKRPIFTIDYKLEKMLRKEMCLQNFEYIVPNDCIKFVCETIENLKYAESVIRKYSLDEKCTVIFSPVYGKMKLDRIVKYVKRRKINGVKVQIQLHKLIWGEDARGV